VLVSSAKSTANTAFEMHVKRVLSRPSTTKCRISSFTKSILPCSFRFGSDISKATHVALSSHHQTAAAVCDLLSSWLAGHP
jgi:hypothetical protein